MMMMMMMMVVMMMMMMIFSKKWLDFFIDGISACMKLLLCFLIHQAYQAIKSSFLKNSVTWSTVFTVSAGSAQNLLVLQFFLPKHYDILK